MKVALVPIGNSRGVRLPKAVLEQVGFEAEAELTIEDGRLVLEPVRVSRQGWSAAFAAEPAALSGEDREWLDAPLAGDEE
jgi:antitoxin MazE